MCVFRDGKKLNYDKKIGGGAVANAYRMKLPYARGVSFVMREVGRRPI